MRHPRPFIVAAALAAIAPVTACGGGQVTAGAPAASPAPSTVPASSSAGPSSAKATPATGLSTRAETKTTARAKPANGTTSDLSGIGITGIRAGKSVLIDVVDDGEDRFLEVGDSAVDFTGTGRTDTTMMALHPAAVSAANRVVIKPPFWDEDLGGGHCVADTTGAALKLELCIEGKASQIFRVVLAGDSGLFELHGAYGVIRVGNGRITTSGDGQSGLQVLPYAE